MRRLPCVLITPEGTIPTSKIVDILHNLACRFLRDIDHIGRNHPEAIVLDLSLGPQDDESASLRNDAMDAIEGRIPRATLSL